MFVFLITILIVFIIFYICEKSKINAIISFFITIATFYLIIFPKSSMDSISSGLNLFITAVFPTLFPFLTLTNMLMNYSGIQIFGKIFGKIISKPLKISNNSIFPLITSFICGYPLGIKYSNELYDKNLLSENEFKRISNIASNASPLFIIASVGISMLNNPLFGYILLIANYLSCILMAYVLPNKNIPIKNTLIKNKQVVSKNLGETLKFSIENALKTCITVGGFIIFFSLIKEILLNNIYSQKLLNDIPIVKSLILGFLEITNGINLLSSLNISINIKLSLISFLCSFSGICIILQCYSFVYKNKCFSIKNYIFYKFIQGILSFIITFVFCNLIL